MTDKPPTPPREPTPTTKEGATMNTEPSPEALERAAQLWCSPHMASEVLDPVFAREIARALDAFAASRPSVAAPPACRGCEAPLLPENRRVADGCPCNSRRGINHGLVAKDTCTCIECDPAQTGSTRYPAVVKATPVETRAVALLREVVANDVPLPIDRIRALLAEADATRGAP